MKDHEQNRGALTSKGIPLAGLAWCAALLPLFTTHTTYLVAAGYGLVDWCVPYWDSCTSISATGRVLPAKYVFKLGMLPAALLTALLWWTLWQWGRNLGVRTTIWMPVLGAGAAMSLILYTLALGEVGDSYRLLRRIGVVLAFALTFIAQVLFTRQTLMLSLRHPDFEFARDYRWMLRLQLVLLSIGMTSVILDGILGDAYDAIEDAFEWWMALLLNGYFVLVARMLRKSGAALVVSS